MNLFLATLKTSTTDTEAESLQQVNSIHADYYNALIP